MKLSTWIAWKWQAFQIMCAAKAKDEFNPAYNISMNIMITDSYEEYQQWLIRKRNEIHEKTL